MEARELRIGNLVYSYAEWHQISCEQVSTVSVVFNNSVILAHGLEVKLNKIKPIPLTEDWLLKLGFGRCDDHVMSIKCFDELLIEYDYHFHRCFVVIDTDTTTDIKWVTHIKHVHQLQNLYFALTGEELKIN